MSWYNQFNNHNQLSQKEHKRFSQMGARNPIKFWQSLELVLEMKQVTMSTENLRKPF